MIIKNLSKKYKEKLILSNVNLEINKNGLYVLYGPSGSGKSTLLNIISGLDKKFIGNCEIIEKVAYCRQSTSLIDSLTLRENILIKNHFQKINENLLIELQIEYCLDTKCSQMSHGERVRADIYLSLLSGSEIILFDEPTSGLNADLISDIIEIIKKLSLNKIIIVATHDEEFYKVAHIVYKLKNQNLIKVVDNKLSENKIEVKQKVIQKFYLSKIMKILFKNNKISYVYDILALSFIFLIFLSCMNFLQDSLNLHQSGRYVVAKDVVSINISKLKDENKMIIRDKINFGSEDLTEIKNNPNVVDAYLFSENNFQSTDNSGNQFEYVNNGQQFLFTKLKFEENEFELFNINNVKLIGNYPKANSDEIIIPSTLCSDMLKQCEQLLNNNIELDVKNKNDELIKKDYSVVGYYDANDDSTSNSYIYTSFSSEKLVNDDDLKLIYESEKQNLNDESVYNDSVFESFESYKKANGDGFTNVLIKTNDVKSLTQQIEQNCKYCNVDSLEQRNNEYLSFLKSLFFKLVMYVVVLIIILNSIYLLIFKSIRASKRADYIKLVMFDYEKNEVVKIMKFELIFKLIIANISTIIYGIFFINNKLNSLLFTFVFVIIIAIYFYITEMLFINKGNYINALSKDN